MKKSKKRYVKNNSTPNYDQVEFDVQDASRGALEVIKKKKVPTSVALDRETILDLKAMAEERGIPYQVLMRSYILQGLKKDKAS